MEVIVHVLFLRDVRVALQTIAVVDRFILHCGLRIFFKIKRDKIRRTRHQTVDAPRYAAVGMTVNAARGFRSVEARQINGLIRDEGTLIKCDLAFGVTRSAETIMILKLSSREHGAYNEKCNKPRSPQDKFHPSICWL